MKRFEFSVNSCFFWFLCLAFIGTQAQFDGKTFIDARRAMRKEIQAFNKHISIQLKQLAAQAQRINVTRIETKRIVGKNLKQAFIERSGRVNELMSESMQAIRTMTPDTYTQTKNNITKKQKMVHKLMKDLQNIRDNMRKLMR